MLNCLYEWSTDFLPCGFNLCTKSTMIIPSPMQYLHSLSKCEIVIWYKRKVQGNCLKENILHKDKWSQKQDSNRMDTCHFFIEGSKIVQVVIMCVRENWEKRVREQEQLRFLEFLWLSCSSRSSSPSNKIQSSFKCWRHCKLEINGDCYAVSTDSSGLLEV